jgi:NAD(P)-dependent dehydrogenase (short-subunit alcohol dehydrogenase family)
MSSSEEQLDITGKHAVVTGGARGIGLAVATILADHGARVSVISRSVPESGMALNLPSGAIDIFAANADITKEKQVVAAIQACRDANGPISILVNNSGVAESAPLLRTTTELWERIIATNLTGTFWCTRESVDDMIRAKWGRIVNVASIAGLGGAPYIAAYCASKHGVIGFTRAVAAEFDGKGVTCNAVCPGYTETDMLRQAMTNISKFTGASEDTAREQLAQSNPGGRIVTVEEVAQEVYDLITGSRTGVSIVIPGGAAA